jgi:endonuclease/exonuclease/phosphatase family metal-dependent hydrolase
MKKQAVSTFVLAVVFTTVMLSSMHSKTPLSERNGIMSGFNFSVLTANVGNLKLGCRKYLNNLCIKEVEHAIATNIQELKPDVITLQEVLAPWQCGETKERNKKKVCYDEQIIPQARRLVGNDYSIICDNRRQFTCIAIKESFGKILDCEKGDICNSARTGKNLSSCDNGFTVSAATIKLNNGFTFDIVNAHLQSTDAECRVRMIKQIFYGYETQKPLVTEDFVLIMGDLNLDPWRDQDVSVEIWKDTIRRGWMGRNFYYHSGIVEKTPPHFTTKFFIWRKTFDLIVSNFAEGTCVVLGETPGTLRIDGGSGMDHRAVYGILSIP